MSRPESVTPIAPPNKIIMIGLGEIAATHQTAFERLGHTVIAGVDIDPSKKLVFNGSELPVYGTVAEAAEEQPATNMIIVAVPTPGHYEVSQEVFAAFDKKPVRVLLEKPCADTFEQVVDLFVNAPDTVELEALLHFAYNPEVLWAAKYLPGWMAKHGPITRYKAGFADPRSAPDQAQRREALGSSWKDLGINALSAAHRLIDLTGIKLHPIPESDSYGASVTFNSGSSEGRGTIVTQWNVEAPAYDSTFVFASGAQLKLNHFLVTGSFENRHGVIQMTTANRGIPRRLSHYLNLYQDILGARDMALPSSDSMELHRLLLSPEIV